MWRPQPSRPEQQNCNEAPMHNRNYGLGNYDQQKVDLPYRPTTTFPTPSSGNKHRKNDHGPFSNFDNALSYESNKEDKSKKKNAYLKAFSTKVKVEKSSKPDDLLDDKNMIQSKLDYFASTCSSSSDDFATKKISNQEFNVSSSVNISHKEETLQCNNQPSTSDSILCYVCNIFVSLHTLYKHLLFGKVKCVDCNIEFNCCEQYRLLNSPKSSFIPSMCIHKNLIFVDAKDFMKQTFSGSDKHITKQVLLYIKSLLSIKNVKPYNLAIKECMIYFGAGKFNIKNVDTNKSVNINKSACNELLGAGTSDIKNLDTKKSETINKSVCTELLSKSQLSSDVSNSALVICYVCHERVPQDSFYKHLWFGSLKCKDCDTIIHKCMEFQQLNSTKNFAPLCLHKNSIFVDPIYFLKSFFFGPNSRKNKLLLEYIKSINSIRKLKQYYYLAFKECKTLNKTTNNVKPIIENDNDNSIKETDHDIKHTSYLSTSEFNHNDNSINETDHEIEHTPFLSTSEFIHNDGVLGLSPSRESGDIESDTSTVDFNHDEARGLSPNRQSYNIESYANKSETINKSACDDLFSEKQFSSDIPDSEFLGINPNRQPYDIESYAKKSETINKSTCDDLFSEKQFSSDIPDSEFLGISPNRQSDDIESYTKKSETINKSTCNDLISEKPMSRDIPESDLIICYVCGENVPKVRFRKHLWFGTLQCQNCDTSVSSCIELKNFKHIKNKLKPSCLHKNSIFVEPVCFLKSNFFGPNSHKNKLLLQYVKSILSIRKLKLYYYLAFKECKKLKRKTYNTTTISDSNKDKINKKKNELKHTKKLSISEYNDDDKEAHWLELPENGNYLIIHETIEICPMCYRKLKPEHSIYSLTLWIYTFICRCGLIIYYIPPTPANIKHPVWVEDADDW